MHLCAITLRYECVIASFNLCKFLQVNSIFLDSEEYSTAGQSNCLRLFALQKVSAEALREVFQRLPGTFVAKINQLKQKCQSKPRKQWKKELLTCNCVVVVVVFCNFVFYGSG